MSNKCEVPVKSIDRTKLKARLRRGDLRRIEKNLEGRFSYNYIVQVMGNNRFNEEIVREALKLANSYNHTVQLPRQQARELSQVA